MTLILQSRNPSRESKHTQLLIIAISALVMCSHLWAPRVILVLETVPLVGSHPGCSMRIPAESLSLHESEKREVEVAYTRTVLESLVVRGLVQTLEEVLRKVDHHFPGYYSANRETSGSFKVVAFGRIIPEAEVLREWESQMVTTYSDYVCAEVDQLPPQVCTQTSSMCEFNTKRSLAVSATYQHISIGQVSFVFAFGLIILLPLRKYVFNS